MGFLDSCELHNVYSSSKLCGALSTTLAVGTLLSLLHKEAQ